MLARKEVWKTWRFELKYRLTLQQYYQFRNALVPYMEQDPYTKPTGSYLVRSLYFDTYDYQAYHEKVNGDYGRIKIRVRAYTDSPVGDPPLRVELKTRWGSAMEKYSCFTTATIYNQFMHTHHWPEDETNPVLIEFARLYHLRTLRPQLLVQYQRQGFKARDNSNLRITFDSYVSSASAETIFPEEPFLRAQQPHEIILEIKCQKDHPRWLSQLVRQHGLKLQANSKYARGIEISRPDVVTPRWSQGYYDHQAASSAMLSKHQQRSLSKFDG
ncbi:MAG TPA: polyphosphate polymerase domain-containing protein [Oscillospiraceae bacterium]|nr:polyphosphate polymerase domain-containing protein [Oscillospiraceae bacterium]